MSVILDPQQELFGRLLVKLRAAGFYVYDGVLPPADTPYPFVYLGDNQQIDQDTKGAVIGTIYQTIHVFHDNVRERGRVSDMLYQIKTVCRGLGHTAHFSFSVHGVDQQILPDTTTETPLLHGVLSVAFQFS